MAPFETAKEKWCSLGKEVQYATTENVPKE